MVRKSAAKVKPIKVENSDKFLKKEELPPIEETWDNIKQVLLNTIEVQVSVAKRIDNLANVRLAAYKFWGNELDAKYISSERMEYFKKLQEMTVNVYENIKGIVEHDWSMEGFLQEEMPDYFEGITPDVNDIETENDLFEAVLIADCIKPWGEKMVALHQQMLDEQAQRKAMEPEEV